MLHLESRTLSTESLARGAALLRAQSMSLEADPLYLELLAEKQQLLVSCWQHEQQVPCHAPGLPRRVCVCGLRH